MEQSTTCGRCGERLVDGRCQACARRLESRFIHREIVALVLLIAVVVVGFFLTKTAAGANRRLHLSDAATWYDRGERALSSGRADQAVTALRRATALGPDRQDYRLALSSALAASGEDDGARQVLLAIRQTRPEDPEINLRLARLAARGDDLPGAVRYYQHALYGLWSGEQNDARRQVRVELIQYLLAHNERARALSELLVLSANLPDSVALQSEAGWLYLRAGEPARGREHFARALQREPDNGLALAGAGEAAFYAGDYAAALRYFRTAASSSRVDELREIAAQVLDRDPLRPALSPGERHARLVFALRHVLARVDACLATANDAGRDRSQLQSGASEAHAFDPALEAKTRRQAPDVLERGVNLIDRVEEQTTTVCGPSSSLDRALLVIGRRHELSRQ
jgi:tetratricopeptide (TPR) repeat protein